MDGRKQLLTAYVVALAFATWQASRPSTTAAWGQKYAPDPGTVLHTSLFFGLLGLVEPFAGPRVTGALGWGTLVALIMAKQYQGAGGTAVGEQTGNAVGGIGAGAIGSGAGAAANIAAGK